MNVVRIDHIQLAMPAGREDDVRRFYRDLLGIPEVPKPPELVARGGAWFERGDLKVHLGIDTQFIPARKAHPAFIIADLSALVTNLKASGIAVKDDEPLDGHHRVYVDDPFGNRIELIEPLAR
jgi:catechol 2,3-dioxygenase-like lactoylglutathione lyase family enzyme